MLLGVRYGFDNRHLPGIKVPPPVRIACCYIYSGYAIYFWSGKPGSEAPAFYGVSEIQFWIAPRYNIGLLREGKFGQYTIYSIITVYIIIIIYSIQYTIHSIQFTLYLQYTVWFKYTVYNIQYTVYIVITIYSMAKSIQYTVYIVINTRYTLYTL